MPCTIGAGGGGKLGSWQWDAGRPTEEKLTAYHTSDEGGVMCCGTPEIKSTSRLKVKNYNWATNKYEPFKGDGFVALLCFNLLS